MTNAAREVAGADQQAAPVRVRRATALSRRSLVVCALLAAGSLAVVVTALCTGDTTLSVWRVASVLLGQGDDTDSLVVLQWRLPRAAAALVFGAALAASGAILQSLTGNRLASPDILGFTAGAHTGALVVIIGVGAGYWAISFGALIGGMVTAILVYALSLRDGLKGFRLVIVGVGAAASLTALNTWIILRADLDVAMTAAVWGAGSLSTVTGDQAMAATIAVAAMLIALVVLAPALRHLELGDDVASSLGVRVERTRLALVTVSVVLVAATTTVAGPISFVALVAPQISQLLIGGRSLLLTGAALVGALLLGGADLLAQHLFVAPIPVGIVTVVIGGCYLVLLLAVGARSRGS